MVIDAYESEQVGGALEPPRMDFHATQPTEAVLTNAQWPPTHDAAPSDRRTPDPVQPYSEALGSQGWLGAPTPLMQAMTRDIPGFGPVVRGVTGDTSSSSRDSHLPSLPSAEATTPPSDW